MDVVAVCCTLLGLTLMPPLLVVTVGYLPAVHRRWKDWRAWRAWAQRRLLVRVLFYADVVHIESDGSSYDVRLHDCWPSVFGPDGVFLRCSEEQHNLPYVPNTAFTDPSGPERLRDALNLLISAEAELDSSPDDYQHLRAVPSYSRLARIWDEHTATSGRFVAESVRKALDHWRIESDASVLELACGTGALLPHLNDYFDRVTGLDRSQAMLEIAQRRTVHLSGVQCVAGDFEHFELGQGFEVILCFGNSLNYAVAPGALANVFRCVTAHLNPGGRFWFDFIAASSEYSSVHSLVHSSGCGWLVDSFDPKDPARAIFDGVMELHPRRAISVDEVEALAEDFGLEFEFEPVSAEASTGAAQVCCVLRRPGSVTVGQARSVAARAPVHPVHSLELAG